MPAFQYKAKSQDAQTVVGQIIADHKEDAVEKINQLGLVPIHVEVAATARQRASLRSTKVRTKEVYLFSRQLVSLLKAGVPILRSLETIGAQVKNPYFRSVVDSIHLGIRGGKSFSDCMKEYPLIFSSLFVALVRTGEESGRLKESILSMAEYLRQQEDLSSRVRTAMAYPMLMAVFGLGTVFFILTYVMPQITGLFVDLGQQLPMPTVIVMTVSRFLLNYWWAVLVAAVGMIGAAKAWARSAAGRMSISRLKMTLPLVSHFAIKVEMARFCRTLEVLLKSSVSIVRALQLAIPVVHNDLVRAQLEKCQDDLIAGRSFGQSLKQSRLIPAMLADIVMVGEEAGALGNTFQELAESYEQEINDTIKILSSLLEPLMIIAVGSVIGFIVVAMLLPIFQMDIFAQ